MRLCIYNICFIAIIIVLFTTDIIVVQFQLLSPSSLNLDYLYNLYFNFRMNLHMIYFTVMLVCMHIFLNYIHIMSYLLDKWY